MAAALCFVGAAMRKVLGIILLIVLGGVYLARASLLARIGGFVVEDDPPVPADAIVVLAGSIPDRIMEAVALYQEGFSRRILLSHDREDAVFAQLRERRIHVPRGHEVNRMIAEQMGVRPEDIVDIERQGESTFGEARDVLDAVARKGYQSILLVTSKYHTYRAGLIFRHVAAGRVRVVVRPSRYDEFRPAAWWRDRESTRRLAIEYEKLLVFLLIDRWRLTPLAYHSAEQGAQ